MLTPTQAYALTRDDKKRLRELAKQVYADATDSTNSRAVALAMIQFHLAQHLIAERKQAVRP